MRLFSAMNASASGLTAERLRMELISSNLANAQTTRTPDGDGPYRRQLPVFSARREDGFVRMLSQFRYGSAEPEPGIGGVRVTGIVGDPRPFELRHEPGHPDADEDGYVSYPNVNVVMEMVDLIGASRAYEANVTAIEAARQMALRALDIGRG